MSSFALAIGEVHQIQLVQLDEVVDRCDAHLRHRGINVEEAEERCRPTQVLQPRLVDIAVHPVDRLDLGRDGQGHRAKVPGNVITGSVLGTTRMGQPTTSGGSINGTDSGHRHLTHDRSPPMNSDNVTPLVGLGCFPAGRPGSDDSGLICYGCISARVCCTALHARSRCARNRLRGLP
jgi:hypothetical protein